MANVKATFGALAVNGDTARDECKAQVDKFIGARYKKFPLQEEAAAFIQSTDKEGFSPTKFIGGSPKAKLTTTKGFNSKNTSVHTPQRSTSPGSTYYATSSTFQSNHDGSNISKSTLLSLKSSLDKIKKSMNDVRTYVTQAEEILNVANQDNCKRRSSSTSTPSESISKRRRGDDNAGGDTYINVGGSSPVVVFTDGSCTNNGFNGARAGIGVYWGPNDHRNLSERLSGRQTNNRAEVYAATRAIQQAKEYGINDLVIKTDSQFLINCITKWIIKWKENGWKIANGKPVQNREELEELDGELQSGINVRWVHVRGHQGIEGNEAADKLANEGAVKPL